MQQSDDIVVPVVKEELTVGAIPVQTGSVRVTKRIDQRNETFHQELRRAHVEVKRIKTERVVDGPQPIEKSGNTLIIPVVTERLRIEKQWVVTEEIHLTQIEEREAFDQTVLVNEEHVLIERLDANGDVLSNDAGENAIAADHQ